MKLTFIILLIALISGASAQLERGVKGSPEDVILVAADDWHATVAATPLAIWSEDNKTTINTLLALPKDVRAGSRMGWVDEKALQTYGISTVIHTLKNAGVTSVTIDGDGDIVEGAVKIARKEGISAYITAGFAPRDSGADASGGEGSPDHLTVSNPSLAASIALIRDTGTDEDLPDDSLDAEGMQRGRPGSDKVGRLRCPVDPEAREELYYRIETIIEDYEADGVVLSDFGFEGEGFCYCDFCQEEFYKDTGIDLTKISSSGYNQERWSDWKQDQILEIVEDVRNITRELGPIQMGVALDDPFDKSGGYNYAEMAEIADFTIISPVPSRDARMVAAISEKPVYIRLSEDYIGYTLSAQNVEGTVRYIEELIASGAGGIAFEYSVVYTPLWYELEPPTPSAEWLLNSLGGKSLGIGNVSWETDQRIAADDPYAMAAMISDRWESSPGVVLVGNNYSAGLSAAVLASYLNWPVLFADGGLTNETVEAIDRLGADRAVTFGPISDEARSDLDHMNVTAEEDDGDTLLREMNSRGDDPEVIVMTNSHDLSLVSPAPEKDIKRMKVGSIIMNVEVSPARIPSESTSDVVRLNISISNVDDDPIKNLQIVDPFPMGRMVHWPRASQGDVVLKDPFVGETPTEGSAFVNGSILIWKVGDLKGDGTANLAVEVEMLYPMDAGWEEMVDGGMTLTHSGIFYKNVTVERKDDWPVTNITYPSEMGSGVASISWNIERDASYTSLNIYGPNGATATITAKKVDKGKRYKAPVPMIFPGTWRFNIEVGDGYAHRTPNYTIDVVPDTKPINVSVYSHTKVPRISLTAAPLAAARKALIFDVNKNPRDINPLEEEERLNLQVDEMKISPEYLITVGDPGSLPFVGTGLEFDLNKLYFDRWEIYDIYRDYRIDLDDDDYSEVATGRIVGLSVYDASQLVARTLAYDRLQGAWKDRALVISTPAFAPPASPTPLRIEEYLNAAGFDTQGLHWEDATYQQVMSQMGNGDNIVHFSHHGAMGAWKLSDWSLLDVYLDGSQVKEMVLAPQVTTSDACETARLKGFSVNLSGNHLFVPLKLEDSIALAFIRAGSVSYVGSNPSSWIFISQEHSKRFYHALLFENATVGQAMMKADNLFRMKALATIDAKDPSEYDDILPDWGYQIPMMLNQTASMNILIGDPCFRPYIPRTLLLPYRTNVSTPEVGRDNTTEVEASITPISNEALDWIYWIDSRGMVDGTLSLNAPPALIGEVNLPKDAEDVVVRENGRVVWHAEDTVGESLKVFWPIVRPSVNATRMFTVEYRVVPGETQVINITAGWNAISIYVDPTDPSAAKHLKGEPYRGIFTASGSDWEFTMKEMGMTNVISLEPGQGYLLDASDDFDIEIEGKPVELPFRLKLHEGWNMIGVPFNTSMSMDNVTVNAEHRRYGYPEAVQKGIISAFLWRYDGGEWTYLDGERVLEPGHAYLIEAMAECRLEFRERPLPVNASEELSEGDDADGDVEAEASDEIDADEGADVSDQDGPAEDAGDGGMPDEAEEDGQ